MALIIDDFAVVWQTPGRDELDPAAQFGDPLKSCCDRLLKSLVGSAAFGREHHDVLLGLAGHRQPHTAELAVALCDLYDLTRIDEHAFDFGRLIGTAHPAFEPHIAASTWRAAREHRREVTGSEPDHGIIGMKAGNDDLADLARFDRIAGARPHNFDDQCFVDHHALPGLRLIGDHAELG